MREEVSFVQEFRLFSAMLLACLAERIWRVSVVAARRYNNPLIPKIVVATIPPIPTAESSMKTFLRSRRSAEGGIDERRGGVREGEENKKGCQRVQQRAEVQASSPLNLLLPLQFPCILSPLLGPASSKARSARTSALDSAHTHSPILGIINLVSSLTTFSLSSPWPSRNDQARDLGPPCFCSLARPLAAVDAPTGLGILEMLGELELLDSSEFESFEWFRLSSQLFNGETHVTH